MCDLSKVNEVTQEAQTGMGGGGEEWEETRGHVTDEEKMEKTRERRGEKRKGDAPQESKVTSKKRA